MWTDLRYAVRALSNNKPYTVMAALTLGAGIGANSAIYSLADAMLFRPLLLPGFE